MKVLERGSKAFCGSIEPVLLNTSDQREWEQQSIFHENGATAAQVALLNSEKCFRGVLQ